MTCRMAAGQQKKRLTSSNLHEQYRGKKKKTLDSSDYVLNLRSHVDLEWDDNLKRAVAKREQIGVTWMNMASFVDSVPKSQSGLADVISVPQEIFSLENLTEVLSYEVWATCLSESERKFLTQFLPSGTGAEQVVHSLLKGENHHFGNPYIKWSASLCSGNLHPDSVVRAEQQFRANRRAYYNDINKYHTGMLQVLKKWKEKWLSCKDPEKLWMEGFTKHKQGSLTVSAEKTKVLNVAKKEILHKICIPKKETPHKICIVNGDSAKYMSYIKISKAQHQLVKNIKHSGDGIQSKSLNRVLGDIKSFHVHAYETFEEEEKKKLHEHWLQVANKDLPAAFEVRRNKKMLREQWMKSLEQELAEKKKLIMDKDEKTENLETSPQGLFENGDYEHQPSPDVTDQEDVDSPHNSTHDHHLESESLPSLSSHLDPMPMESSPTAVNKEAVGQDILKFAENSPSLSQSLEKENPSDEDVTQAKASPSSAKDLWQTESVHDPYYQTTPESHGYRSAGELSLRQPQLTEEHPTDMIDLERNIIEPEAGAPVASTFHVDGGESLFGSYANQDRNELLPSFSRGPGILSSYPDERMNGMKQPGLQFLMANDSLPEPGQFSHQFHEQQQQRQVREKELYMNQIMNKNVYSSGRYPCQGHFSSVDQHSFSALQSSVNGGSMGYNWFPGEHQGYNNWSGAESSSSRGQCLLDGSNADGSLFSVFSNKMSSCSPYNAASSEQYIQARNYPSVGGLPAADYIYGYARHQPDNSGSQESAAAPSMNNMSWMNLPHQNPGLPDSMGKPFLRPWNR